MHGPEEYPGFGASQRTADGERAVWSGREKNNREQPEERSLCCTASTAVQAAASVPSRTGRRRSVTAAKKENCRMHRRQA